MNEKTAHAKELVFTGIYSRSKEEAKAKIEENKVKYPKAKFYLVTSPDSPLSRGVVGIGYSVYATNIYSEYKVIEQIQPSIDSYPRRAELLRQKYEKDLMELNTQMVKYVEWVREAEKKLLGT